MTYLDEAVSKRCHGIVNILLELSASTLVLLPGLVCLMLRVGADVGADEADIGGDFVGVNQNRGDDRKLYRVKIAWALNMI